MTGVENGLAQLSPLLGFVTAGAKHAHRRGSWCPCPEESLTLCLGRLQTVSFVAVMHGCPGVGRGKTWRHPSGPSSSRLRLLRDPGRDPSGALVGGVSLADAGR